MVRKYSTISAMNRASHAAQAPTSRISSISAKVKTIKTTIKTV